MDGGARESIAESGRRRVGHWARQALDAVLPPRCPACGEITPATGVLCQRCWGGIDFIAPPYCACCGLPFEFDMGAAALCGPCLAEPPTFERARAVMVYDDASRGLILAFKHADRLDGAPAYAAWMARAGGELMADCDLVVPVPLHWRRLFQRRYNQAAALAQRLARSTDRAYAPDLLARRRATPSQGRLTRAGRARNVAGAFAVRPEAKARLAGRRILLIDDVMTTGATVEACAKALKRGGASAVDVLVLARVTRAAG